MQQGQVSIWVPIIVGAIGFIGVVAGQLVNAWREDRRWKREQEREELRWKRQREADDVKYFHESGLDWREKRIELYGDYLNSVRIFEEHLGKFWFSTAEALDEHQKEEYAIWQDVERAARRVEFVASDDGLALLHEFRDKMKLSARLLAAQHNTECNCVARGVERLRKKYSDCQAYDRKFVNCMRAELGATAQMARYAPSELQT
ncbi:hypothetical protein [Kibdelosporangium aridum]|uniref:hypothetical protein n=1 Tax=Kibdelosporangium aridum TaxID=2030 RepID=UPI0035E57457